MSFTWNGFTFDSQTGTLTSAEFEGKTYGLNGCLWNVELLDCENKKILSPMVPMAFCYVESPKTLQLQWESHEASVRVYITAQDGKTYWSISTASDSYAINKVVFPIIKGFDSIKKSGREDYLLIPWQNGWVIQNPTEDLLKNNLKYPFWLGRGGHRYESEYPAALNFQFSAYYADGGIGCYMATEDADANIKTYGYYLEGEGDFSFRITNYPENMGRTKSYNTAYNFVFAFYHGDWQEAAVMYRQWAVNQKWCSKGKLTERRLPQNLTEVDLWRINHATFALGTRTDEYFSTCKTIRDKLQCKLGLHWYGWNMGQHDVNYPEYISRERYAEGWDKELTHWNTRFEEEGIVRIPYINARLWDKNCPAWAEDEAHKAALKDENQAFYYEPWRGDDSLKPMCPATSLWQNKVVDFCSRYILENGFNGIYLDQIGSYNSMLCFDESHPHPRGGGSWWNDSYHAMIMRLRERVGQDKIFTTESCCETYIDVLDSMLVLDQDISPFFGFNGVTEDKHCESIPLFNMVYGDYATSYGSVCRFNDELSLFEYKFIRNIIWGFIPTVEGIEQAQIEENAYFAVLKRGTDFYRTHKELFLYGRITKLLDFPQEQVSFKWEYRDIFVRTYPAIIAAQWTDPAGNVTNMAYNASDAEVMIHLNNREVTVAPHSFAVV